MSGVDKTGKPEDQGDLAADVANRYDQAIVAFNQGDHGHTLYLLSQISKLKPDFDDHSHLRERVAAALDQQQRNVVFNEAKAKVDAALEQGRWDDIPSIIAAMHGRLEAENLALNDTQRLLVNQWSVSAGRRGGSRRAKRATQAKQRLTPPTAPLTPPVSGGLGTGSPKAAVQKPPSLLRRNQELMIGCAVITALGFLLATVVFLGVSANSDQVTEVADDLVSDEAETVPAEEQAEVQAEEQATGEAPVGIDRLRAIWADERQSIIDDLNTISQVGIGDDLTLVGPPGVNVDLSACPAGWDDTQGIEDGVVHLAMAMPQSGGLAAYGQFGAGVQAYFDQVNQRGGLGPDGLQVEVSIYDDGYNTPRTEEIVNELLAGDQPFAITTLGTPNTLAVYDALNDACVPQPTVLSSHPAWTDPQNKPWTTGLDMSFATEARLWGAWIEQNFPSSVTVAALVMDNDFGRIYEQAFSEYAETNPRISSVEFVRHDPVASTVTEEMTALAALEPTIFISMTAGNPCLLAIEAAAETGLAETAEALITPSACTNVPAYLAPAEEAADGWLTFGGGLNDLVEPGARAGIYSEYVVESLSEAGLDRTNTLAAEGFGFRGWTLHQILEVAANLEGGLSRSNLLIAQWGLRDMTHPSVLNGISFGTYGILSPSFIEGSDISRFDAASQSWALEDTIDRKGTMLPCRWSPELGCT